MKIKEILETIKSLAQSQEFYERLLGALRKVMCNDPYKWAEVVEVLEGQHFKDSLDLIMYFEQ